MAINLIRFSSLFYCFQNCFSFRVCGKNDVCVSVSIFRCSIPNNNNFRMILFFFDFHCLYPMFYICGLYFIAIFEILISIVHKSGPLNGKLLERQGDLLQMHLSKYNSFFSIGVPLSLLSIISIYLFCKNNKLN